MSAHSGPELRAVLMPSRPVCVPGGAADVAVAGAVGEVSASEAPPRFSKALDMVAHPRTARVRGRRGSIFGGSDRFANLRACDIDGPLPRVVSSG